MFKIEEGQVWKYNDIRNVNRTFKVLHSFNGSVSVLTNKTQDSKTIRKTRLVSSSEKRGYTFLRGV